MALTIDELQIQIEAESNKATDAIDTLIGRLESLQSKMSVFNSIGKSFSNTFGAIGNATQKAGNTAQKAKNSFGQLKDTIKAQEKELKILKSEYASYVLSSQQGSAGARDFAAEIKNLSDRLESNKSSLKNAQAETEKLTQKHLSFKDAAKKAKTNVTGFTDKLAGSITKARTLYSAFNSVAQSMAGWYNESNDYIETWNLFQVTMGEAKYAAREYAETVEAAMGIDSKDFMQFQGTFKNLTAGFGVATEDANKMSQNLTQLSYDMASFFNTDVETAFDKLSSAMSGQVKGLREFGIDTTVATLQEYALSKGIETKVRNMTQAEKAMLRYNYILEKSTHMQGDMARTIITPANALRVLESQLTRMKRGLGNIVSMLVTKFIPYIQVMVEVIADAANALAKFFGFNENDFAADTDGITSSWGAAEEGVGDYSDAVKEAKKQMMGFDELNIISSPDSNSDSGSASGLGNSLNGMELRDYDFLKELAGKTEEVKEKMKATIGEIAGLAGGAMLAIGAILTFTGANVPLGLGLMIAGISGVALAIDWAFLENPFGSTLSTLTGIVGGALLALGGILAFSGVAIPLGITFLAAGAATLLSAVAINWDGLTPNVKKTLGAISGAVGGALLVLGALLAFTGVAIPLGIGFMAAGAVSIGAAAKLNWDSSTNKVSGVVATIGAVVGGASLALGALLAFTGVNIPLGVGLMAIGAATLFTAVAPNWNSMSEKTKNTISIISAIVGGAMLVLGVILAFTGVGIPLAIGLIAGGAASLAAAIAPNWGWVKEKLNTVLASTLAIISGFGLVLGVLLLLVPGALPLGLGLIFASLKGTQAAAKMDDNPVTRFVKKMANAIINIFNGVIEAINDIFHIQFDGLVIAGIEIIPKIDTRLVNIPKISLLAKGGFPSVGEMFIAREAGPELVGSIGRKTAVANNDQIVSGIESGVYRAMMAANSVNKGGSQTIRIINEIDGDIVGEKVIQYHNGKVMQTGASPLLV